MQVLDPNIVKDFSQFSDEMDHVCFPPLVPISEEYDGQSMLQMNDRLQLDLTDQDLPLLIG